MADYQERLRRLAVNDPRYLDHELGGPTPERAALDLRTLALTRFASLVAVGGSEPTFGDYVDAALSEGASCDEIVDVLVGVGPVVGAPRVVSAAARVALALGIELDVIVD